MDHTSCCSALDTEVTSFADVVRGVDFATPVPTCPKWTLAQLVKHTGSAHRWAERMVREVTPEILDPRSLDLGLPEHVEAYPEWLAAGGAALVSRLRAADPDAAMWAWGADQHARFWSRRMLHETTVHRSDAELSLGRAPAIDAAIAVDGIDELLDNLRCAGYFAPSIAELRGSGESLHLHSTDTEGEWMIHLGPDGYSWERAHGKGSVAVRGTAGDLLLLLYGRRDPGDARFEHFGHDALLAFWLQHAKL